MSTHHIHYRIIVVALEAYFKSATYPYCYTQTVDFWSCGFLDCGGMEWDSVEGRGAHRCLAAGSTIRSMIRGG